MDVWNIYFVLPKSWFENLEDWEDATTWDSYEFIHKCFDFDAPGQPFDCTYLGKTDEGLKVGNDYAHCFNDAYYSYEEMLKEVARYLRAIKAPKIPIVKLEALDSE
jgi:hypothetical protein